MKLHMILLLVTSALGILSAATADEMPSIKKGTEIRISKFEAKCKCFEIVITQESAVGPNYAKVKHVVDAMDYKGDLKSFKQDLKNLEGKTFVLKKDLELLTDKEMEKFDLI